MIILLVLFALLILYSFFFDKRNNRSYQKPAHHDMTIRKTATPPVFLKVIDSASEQAPARQSAETIRPNLQLIMGTGKQRPKK
ncbi:hypothetical protein P8884_03455 [Bacillus haynesii]|nr:hypothetical protein [Bacillus haynesii]